MATEVPAKTVRAAKRAVAAVTDAAAAVLPVDLKPAATPSPLPAKETSMDATIKDAAATAQAQAKTMFAEANERAKGAMEKGAKSFEDMNEFAKGNVEAVVESARIYAKGLETLGQDAAAFAKKSFEDATAAFKTLSTVKSPTEFLKLQSDYARTSFDALVAETSRSTEKMVKLASEVAQPISNRVALAAEKMKVAA